MIGDARAVGKRHSTRAHGPEFKKKLSEDQAHKHIDGARASYGGGDHENAKRAKSVHRTGPRPGVNVADRQAPHKQRARIENKHIDQGQLLDQWCRGARKDYR